MGNDRYFNDFRGGVMEELVYWSLVQKIWGIKGNKYLLNIIEKIKGSDFWHLSEKEILKEFPDISQGMVKEVVLARDKLNHQKEYEKIRRLGIKIYTIGDNKYPQSLKNIYDPPPLLYVRGKLVEKNLAIAVVGARKASPYGKKVAYDLAAQLSDNNIQIISGMARGIDASSHQGALAGKGGTIAVLGSGIDIIYPRENRGLYDKIINLENSAVISELPLGSQPLKHHFPLRNRIISGLATGIVVIEAGEKSGSLITAELGLEQGKDVFSVPGPITSPLYKGSHKLIKDGAKLVDCVDDILEEYGQMSLFNDKKYQQISLNATEKRVLGALSIEPSTIEEIALQAKLTITEVIAILSVLEIKGLAKQQAGRKFISIN